jgi:hypothetical protein
MIQRNQTPALSTRARAAKRKDRVMSVVLFVVIAAGIALTAFIWVARTGQ